MKSNPSAEISTPDSSRWTTPAVTPSQAWTERRESAAKGTAIDSDDDKMTEECLRSEYPVILVSKEEKERLRRPWRRSLIIKLLGRTVGYNFLLQRLQRMWRTDASFDLISLDQDYFLVRFENLKDYESVKFGGPYMVFGHYLVSQEWVPNFVPKNNKVRKMLVWIRFPALPIEYFDDIFLKRIGTQIGRPIKVDTTTSLASKGRFARVCVEVDITKPLVSKFVLDFQE
ncbi:PREDICTED: uncharacterized protein LOC109166607 [Ipomoea nil]|uniref:uncharacterized protein LOC109166607 n=1 Tax=Ipomoea nil TaxID=35883 RepID=UPI0009014064|nr:PREDICTED: uncharacterized protein LOC109166607 [Ipomoea nil]